MIRRIVLVAALAVPGSLMAPAVPAAAHPLGNFTVNTYSGIVVTPGVVQVNYVLDLAEIPTFEEMAYLDTDLDGVAEGDERATWAVRKARGLGRQITLIIDGHPVPLRVVSSRVELGPGQGGLQVLRLEVTFAAEVAGTGRLVYRDGNFPDLIGWREVTAVGMGGRTLSGSSVPARSTSNALRDYPDDLLTNPLDVTEASFSFAPGRSGEAASEDAGTTEGRPDGSGGGFAGLVSRPDLSIGFVALALILAIGFGALHALAPGHGKTITAAYLVGAGARATQALAVGAAVSVMHTASVLGLGIVILSVQRVFPAERVYPWLGLAAGLVALGLGTWLFITRIQAWTRPPSVGNEGHDHEHGHDHPAGGEDHHQSVPESRPGAMLSRSRLLALALSGGLLPSPAALVVLLGSVALNRLAFGLALIAAFSVGLAGALTAIGLLAVRARDLVAGRLAGRLGRLIPAASAALIVVVGAALVIRSVTQL